MQPLLSALGRNQLHVHTFLEDPPGDRRDGALRHERFLCLPALLGDSARTVRRYTREYLMLCAVKVKRG